MDKFETKYNPTLFDSKHFNAQEDAKKLYYAMKGLGTDEDGLIEILAYRSCNQRLEIRDKYCSMYGKQLKDAIHKETSGHFRRVLEGLLTEKATYAANCLYVAMKGAGTDEEAITQILCTATNEEIWDIKEAYLEVLKCEGRKDPSRNLENDLKSDISGYYKRLIIAIVQGNREYYSSDELKALNRKCLKEGFDFGDFHNDFNDIYDAGKGKLGTNETTFVRLCGNRSPWHIRILSHLYLLKTGESLIQTIESETSGDFRKALKLILSMCIDSTKTFAKLLYKSMSGTGTSDNTLVRIIVSRCEIDLGEIRNVYEQEYGHKLEDSVREDTSGHYRKILLALLGADWKK